MRRSDGRTVGRTGLAAGIALFLTVCPSVRLMAQCPDGAPPPCNRAVRAAPAPTSVAVLSFDNRSRDTADAFLAEGLADEISTRLGQIGKLAIVSRSQVRRLRDVESMPVPAIGRALNSANLVHGSVQGTPTHLRVSVELLRASSGAQVWSHVYDRDRSDLLEIQGDIATEVAQQITGTLRPGDRAVLARAPTRSPEAYEHILRGDVLASNRNSQRVLLAIREYEAAIRLDPESPRAQASLAKGYSLCRDYLCPIDVPLDTLPVRARRAASAALRLDSSSADAWLATAFAAYTQRPMDAATALRSARRAVQLDSTNAEAWHFVGWLSLLAGQDSAAERAYRRALHADPGRGVTYEHIARIRIIDRRYDAARALLDTALALEPLFGLGFNQRAMLRAHLGDVAGAVSDAEQVARLSTDTDPRLRVAAIRAYALFQSGDTARARVLADSLAPNLPHAITPVSESFGVVFVMFRLGRVDEAMRIIGIVTDGSASSEAAPPGVLDFADFFFQLWTRMPYWDPARGNPAFERSVAHARETWRDVR